MVPIDLLNAGLPQMSCCIVKKKKKAVSVQYNKANIIKLAMLTSWSSFLHEINSQSTLNLNF